VDFKPVNAAWQAGIIYRSDNLFAILLEIISKLIILTLEYHLPRISG
jgi:hypothetical protein